MSARSSPWMGTPGSRLLTATTTGTVGVGALSTSSCWFQLCTATPTIAAAMLAAARAAPPKTRARVRPPVRRMFPSEVCGANEGGRADLQRVQQSRSGHAGDAVVPGSAAAHGLLVEVEAGAVCGVVGLALGAGTGTDADVAAGHVVEEHREVLATHVDHVEGGDVGGAHHVGCGLAREGGGVCGVAQGWAAHLDVNGGFGAVGVGEALGEVGEAVLEQGTNLGGDGCAGCR